MASRDQEPQTTLHPRGLARAGRSPSVRRLMLCAPAAVTALMAAAAAQSAPPPRLKSPSLDAIGRAAAPIPDSIIRGSARTLALAPTGYWGGQYKVATGELVTVYASNSYAMDPALGQRWADFLASLVHGPEISTVTVLLSTSTQIARVCGGDALACYSPQGALLYAPGDDPSSDLSAEAVITHEYGHHVAASRSNNPWVAEDWGPKRWASAEQVCARTNTFSTPLDGTLRVSVRSSSGLRVALDVYASTTRVAHASGAGTLTRST